MENRGKKKQLRKWVLFTLRWGVAVVGIWYVVKNISLHDRVLLPDATGRPVEARLVAAADESAASFEVYDPLTGDKRTVERTDLLTKAGIVGEKVNAQIGDQLRLVEVLALRVTTNADPATWPLVVGPPRNIVEKYFNARPLGEVLTIAPSQLAGERKAVVAYPLIDYGMKRIIADANGWYLLLAVLVFPMTFILVSARWTLLIRMLGLQITASRAFALTMVGQFYNNFMPGSTGGDLLKAYYASKNTPKRTQVVLSVLIDRIVGLLALIILGGTMAAIQWHIPQCRKIAIASGLILLMVALGLTVFYVPVLRRLTGLNFILGKLPMQKQVQSAVAALNLYGQRPWLMLGTLVMSFPVHVTCIVSAMFAGKAFGLPLEAKYYWVVVPVVVLSGAIPISPQGAGVMEFFAILLTKKWGCTVTHAFLLTMSIRLVQMLWNLSGAFFVLRGGYHAPPDSEKDAESPEPAAPAQPAA
jgi:uncharacterized protein (TIRG00374 family)